MLRHRVRAPSTLGATLASLGIDHSAIADGRVFVGRRRALSPREPLRAGDDLLVHDPQPAVSLPEPFVLHDQDGVLVVDKPAGLPTIPDQEGSAHSLLALAARATDRASASLHPTSRLDREVSGVVTFATTPAAQASLAAARSAGAYTRLYVALAQGVAASAAARWAWSLAKDRPPRVHRAVEPGTKGALPAASRMVVASCSGAFVALALAPETGRTHQLRVHAAAAGLPLVGDRVYGGPVRVVSAAGVVRAPGRIALHCARVDIGGERGHGLFRSPLPRELVELAAFLGLDLAEALACVP